MFNKTAIIKKENNFRDNKSRPKPRKDINIKKSITNLKISFIITNTNNSSNISNLNMKSASNSKITPQSSSILRSKTQTQKFIRKSLFDDKETNHSFNKKISTKKSSIKNIHIYDEPSSAKFNKIFNLKTKSKFIIKRPENKIPNKGYYLTGELPYRNAFISEAKDNSTLSTSHYKITSNKIKNKFIQCNTINTFTDDNCKSLNKLLNIKKNDIEIEKLAKHLKLSLNLDEKRQKTRCGCGNLITLKNGFFNGVNLVMNYSPIKDKFEIEKSKTINNNLIEIKSNVDNDNNNENNINKINNANNINSDNNINKFKSIISDSFNYVPRNLPMFLREKFNIKGTTILSPFCIEARDDFLFKKLLYDKEKKNILKRKDIVDNKLNIFYAENQNQYDKNLLKHNLKLKRKGKKVFHNIGPSQTEMRLTKIKSKMNFMKKIIDYAYPNMVLARVRESERVIRKNNLSELPPFKRVEIMKKKKNAILGDFLRKSINIKH